MIQLDLFQVSDNPYEKEINEIREIALDTKKSSDKVRKGLFARHGELAKMYMEIHLRLEVIEKNLCKKG